jgi:hypothetical protein
MNEEEQVIHLDWDGPFTLDQLKDGAGGKGPTDYGVYQIYGTHPVYGPGVLLYIGKAAEQTFRERILQESWWDNVDTDRIEVYLGRLYKPKSERTPNDEEWSSRIGLAELLLILQHAPAYNAQGVSTFSEKHESELQNVRVINWGRRRSLVPEVSGSYWRGEYFKENYNHYGQKSTPQREAVVSH